jgi:putative oxidoreductase
MHLGLFVLRLVVGGLFVGHGAQKLFGSFGGHGLEGTSRHFEAIGLRPGRHQALAAGLSEFLGGGLLALGLLTPIATMVLIAVMTAAVVTVHYAKGLWAGNGGYEYNLVMAAAAFALAGVGPGHWSLDHAIGLSDHGVVWALGALAAGLAGGAAAVAAGRWVQRNESQSAHPTPA